MVAASGRCWASHSQRWRCCCWQTRRRGLRPAAADVAAAARMRRHRQQPQHHQQEAPTQWHSPPPPQRQSSPERDPEQQAAPMASCPSQAGTTGRSTAWPAVTTQAQRAQAVAAAALGAAVGRRCRRRLQLRPPPLLQQLKRLLWHLRAPWMTGTARTAPAGGSGQDGSSRTGLQHKLPVATPTPFSLFAHLPPCQPWVLVPTPSNFMCFATSWRCLLWCAVLCGVSLALQVWQPSRAGFRRRLSAE